MSNPKMSGSMVNPQQAQIEFPHSVHLSRLQPPTFSNLLSHWPHVNIPFFCSIFKICWCSLSLRRASSLSRLASPHVRPL